MRSAAASFDDDFDLSPAAPKRRTGRPTAKRRPPNGAPPARAAKRARFPMRNVARYAAMGMSAAFVVAIVANALMAQKGQHPAPLFGKAIALGNASPGPAAAPRLAGPSGPKASQARQSSLAPTPTPTSGAAPHPAAAPSKVAASEAVDGDDPIARLISGGSASPSARKVKHHATTPGASTR